MTNTEPTNPPQDPVSDASNDSLSLPDKAKRAAGKLSDKIEDMIPGDKDGDGH